MFYHVSCVLYILFQLCYYKNGKKAITRLSIVYVQVHVALGCVHYFIIFLNIFLLFYRKMAERI